MIVSNKSYPMLYSSANQRRAMLSLGWQAPASPMPAVMYLGPMIRMVLLAKALVTTSTSMLPILIAKSCIMLAKPTLALIKVL